ncbi:Ig-like domain-containing protein [Ruminococcus sp. 5_1_39BFAA]|uniref:Ig-like domain-containing protein n=1 Tax=Ruminococcus sp. 5_1_39BFAA TaxID=457412 RepID=UPI00356A6938
MKKKWLSYLLSLAMVTSTFSPAAVNAEDWFSAEEVQESIGEYEQSPVEENYYTEDSYGFEGEDVEPYGEDVWEEAGESDSQNFLDFADEEITEYAVTEEEGDDTPAQELPEVSRTVYYYVPVSAPGSTSYKYIYPKDYFENGSEYTYDEPIAVKSDSSRWFNGQIIAEVTNTFETQKWIITAKDQDGNAVESIALEIVGVALKASVTNSDDFFVSEKGNEFTYVYDEADTELVTAHVDTEVYIGGEKVEELPEGMELKWYLGNTTNLTSDGQGNITLNKVNTNAYVYPFVSLKEGNNNYWDGAYASLRFIVYPRRMQFSESVYTLSMPEDGYISAPTKFSWGDSMYSGSECTLSCLDPDIVDVSLSYSTISVTPKKTGTARVLAQWNTDPTNCTIFKIQVLGVSVAAADGSDNKYIYLDPADETVVPQLQLKAQGTKRSEAFTWSSSDETVATVDETGLVTGLKEGPVTIYAVSSLSTEELTVKGAVRLEVIENKKPYLSDMSFYSSNMFEGWTGNNSNFRASQYDYDIKIKTNNNTLSIFRFTPYFDSEKFNAVLSTQEYGGAYIETVLENGVEVNKANALEPGWNAIYIDVTDKEDETNTARYTFNMYRPYTTTNTITRMTVLPNGQTALTYPKYKNVSEGTIFQYTPETDTLGRSGFSGSVYDYKLFVFGERTDTIVFTPYFGNAYEHVYLRKDDGEMQIQTHNWPSAEQELNETGVTKFTFEVMSDQAYADAKKQAEEAGTAFEFTPEKTYTLYVEKVSPLGIDAKILSAELTGAEFYAPGFKSDTYTTSALVDSGAEECTMKFTVPDGIEVFNGTMTDANRLEGTQEEGSEEGILTYEITVEAASVRKAVTINLRKWNEDQTESGASAYTFTFNTRGPKDAIPDSVEGYLCVGSQYTNAGSYGLTPERTLINGGSTLSVGGFGGYITWKYDTPIENSANNPYGVDFIVYGNPFAAQQSAAEPGNVMVSQDGVNWYYLAGSVHYDDETDWDYSVTYTNDGGQSSWVDNRGNSGTNYKYPDISLYPLHNWESENQESVTVSGVRLNNDTKDPYGSASAAYPDFGYVDVNVIGSNKGIAANPYSGTHVSYGDAFDLDWAVDGNGMPVHLDSISYIRVSTASHIYAGAIGEKSTEVTNVYRVSNPSDTAVGTTEAPTSITVNDIEVSLDSEVTTVDYTGEALNVKVSVPEGTNVYINGAYGTERSYETAPAHRIIRVITQEGEKEPDIRYIRLHQIVDADSVTVDASEKTIKEGESFTLTAVMAPEDAVDTVSWVSSDESVATVADGVVTGVKAGKAVITAQTTSGATAECAVTVECIHSGKIILITDTPATCTSEGIAHRVCTLCKATIEENVVLPKIAHKWSEWKVTKEATYTEAGEKERSCSVCGEKATAVILKLNRNDISNAAVTGISDMVYTGKELVQSALSVQTADGKVLTNGTDYTVEYSSNVNIGTATVVITGKGAYEGTIRKTFNIIVKVGGLYTVGTLKYKITNACTNGKGTVAVVGTTKTKAKLTSLTVDSTVIIGSKSFMITSIADKAFRNYTKLKAVSLGLNIKAIGKQAFSGCKNLKTILMTSKKLKTVGKNAIKSINAKAVIDVTDSKVKSYKKIFKSSTGFKSTMTVK